MAKEGSPFKFTSLHAPEAAMNAHLLKSSLLIAGSLMTCLPVFPQNMQGGHEAPAQNMKTATISIIDSASRVNPVLSFTTNGPADPTNPSKPLFCNEKVRRQFREAFMKTRDGEARAGLAEAGRSIELNEGEVSFGSWATTELGDGDNDDRANKMHITRDDSTIAFFHTHGNNARPVPSARDLKGDVPDFVISRFAVYVTIPGTNTYLHLDPAVCK
jgi:hypothetical protein